MGRDVHSENGRLVSLFDPLPAQPLSNRPWQPYKKTKITALCTVKHERENTVFFWYMVEADNDGNPQTDLTPEFMVRQISDLIAFILRGFLERRQSILQRPYLEADVRVL